VIREGGANKEKKEYKGKVEGFLDARTLGKKKKNSPEADNHIGKKARGG